MLCDFLHIFVLGDSTPVTTSMSLVGSELTGENLCITLNEVQQAYIIEILKMILVCR